MKDFIKKNKKGVVIGIIVFVILLFILFLKVLLPDLTKSSWGNRLDGIKDHPIKEEVVDKIKSGITGTGSASNVEYRLSGRTINFVIKVKSGVNESTAEGLTSQIIDNIDDSVKSYYDIQVYFDTEDTNSSTYPFIGYKHKTSSEFSYSHVGDVSE